MVNFGEETCVETEGVGDVGEEHALGYHGDEADILQVGKAGRRAAQLLCHFGIVYQNVEFLKEWLGGKKRSLGSSSES